MRGEVRLRARAERAFGVRGDIACSSHTQEGKIAVYGRRGSTVAAGTFAALLIRCEPPRCEENTDTQRLELRATAALLTTWASGRSETRPGRDPGTRSAEPKRAWRAGSAPVHSIAACTGIGRAALPTGPGSAGAHLSLIGIASRPSPQVDAAVFRGGPVRGASPGAVSRRGARRHQRGGDGGPCCLLSSALRICS